MREQPGRPPPHREITEVYTFLPHTAPMIWSFAKLQWDASLDIDDLLSEVYTKIFGSASSTMERYFDLLEKSWNTSRPGRKGWVHRNIINQSLAISPQAVDEGMALLERAMKEAGSERVRSRIDTIQAALLYASYPIRSYALSRELSGAGVTSAEQAEQVLEKVETLSHLSAEREQTWAEAPKRADLLGENLRGLMGKKYLATGKVADVEKGGYLGALKVLQWYVAHAPEKLPEVSSRLTNAAKTGEVANTVRAWIWVSRSKPENLVRNPGFDDRSENKARAEKDWQTKGAPKDWSVWSRSGRADFRVRGSVGRNGSAAASIAQADLAVYLQKHPVKPGERYLCTAWGKMPVEGKKSGNRIGHLMIRFQKKSGGWHPRHDLEPQIILSTEVPDWQPLVLFITVPEGAGNLVIMAGASVRDQGPSVLFDDIALYRLPKAWSSAD